MDASAQRVQFVTERPVSREAVRSHVQHALSLGLPELRGFDHPFRSPLHIVANGPSARVSSNVTLALNGALSLWLGRASGPTFWAACDPQALVARFLPANPSRGTQYLVASKCHPDVFTKLMAAGVTVRLWHVDEDDTRDLLDDRDRIGPGVSITNTAFELGVRLGFRAFHTYGWDGCFALDGTSHSGPGETTAELRDIIVTGRTFRSTTTWALELQDAAARLLGFPFPIHIHGDGMFAAGLRYLLPNRVTTD